MGRSIMLLSAAAWMIGVQEDSWTTAFAPLFVSQPRNCLPFVHPLRGSELAAQRRGRPKGPLRTFEVKPAMNEEITHSAVRVVIPNADGSGKDVAVGVMSNIEAIAKAQEAGVDLILINENADPPVCKIMDYSKFRYAKEKAAKEKKKNSKTVEVKEVKMSYKIDTHDYDVRKKSASKFIQQGNRVKCTVVFKGREVQHDNLGFELLEKLANDLSRFCTMEGKPKREGRSLACVIAPKPEVFRAINERKRLEEREARKKKEASKAEFLGKNSEKEFDSSAVSSIAIDEEYEDRYDDDDDSFEEDVDELLGEDNVTADLLG